MKENIKMTNQSKAIVKSAVDLFIQVPSVSLALLVFLFVYLVVKVGWTEALESAMEDGKGWLRALILIPTFCVAGDLLGNVIDRLWRSRK